MRHYLFFAILILLVGGCRPTDQNIQVNHDRYSYYIFEDEFLVNKDPGDMDSYITGNYYALSKHNCGGSHINDLDTMITVPDTIAISLCIDIDIDSSDSLESDYAGEVKLINTILKNMNIGYQIKLHTRRESLSGLITKGSRNKENIFNDIEEMISMDFLEDSTYVFLFDESDFFSTASAICMFNGDVPVIFGDVNLLKSPMIFIHELGHSLGLTHSNTIVNDTCRVFNFMHESNIGCSYHITNRQIFIAQEDEFVPKIKNDVTNVELCDCDRNQMNNIAEGYINSLDRNIDDTPVIENFNSFFNDRYRDELTKGVLNSDIETALLMNYEREWDILVNDTSIREKDDYAQQRLEVHKALRKNNLARWLEHYTEENSLSKNESINFYNQDSLFYIEHLDKVDSLQCNDILSELISKYNEIIDLRQRLNLNSSNIDLGECYIKSVNELFKDEERNGEVNSLENFLRNFYKNNDSNLDR